MPRRPRPDDPNSPDPECPPFDEPPRYAFVRSLPTLAHRVMRRAVLDRVLGNIDHREPAVVLGRYLQRVRRRWIDLATEYFDPVLMPNDYVRDRLQGLLDRRPPFAYVMPGGYRPCGTPTLCPSCRARDAAAAWAGLDRGLFGAGPGRADRLSGASMVVRYMTYWFWRVPVRPDMEEVAPDAYVPLGPFLDRRTARAGRSAYVWPPGDGGPAMPRRPSEFQTFARRGAVCGLEATRIGSYVPYPEVAESRKEACVPWRRWVVRFTTILFAPTGSVARVVRPPFDSAPGVACGRTGVPDGEARVRVVAGPSREQVAYAVADACRYPAAPLLRGDRGTVVEYLDARYGRRLRASFGDPAGLRATPPGGE
jgi:hypothetical protein